MSGGMVASIVGGSIVGALAAGTIAAWFYGFVYSTARDVNDNIEMAWYMTSVGQHGAGTKLT